MNNKSSLKVIILLLACIYIASASTVKQITIRCNKDASIVESTTAGCTTNCKDDNYGKELSLISSSIRSHSKIMVGFTMLPSALQSHVRRVYLVLPKASSIVGSSDLLVKGTSSEAVFDWNELSITWNTQPMETQSVATIQASYTESAQVDISTYYMQQSGKQEMTLIMESDGTIILPSKENGENIQLVVEYDDFSSDCSASNTASGTAVLPKPAEQQVATSSAFKIFSVFSLAIAMVLFL